ncbi:MAG: hypothetical protein U0031_02540 [Thermomicrobiales bacterium]
MSPEMGIADRLSAHLDAVVTGAPPQPTALDPAMAESVDRFFAADDAPSPPPGLADRVWEDLLFQTNARPVGNPREVLGPSRDDTARPSAGRLNQPPRDHTPPSRRMLTHLATAALVLLTLVGSLLALRGPLRLVGQEEQPASIPAVSGTPNITTVMETVVTEWPAPNPLLIATLRRETLDPGAVEKFGVADTSGDSVDLFRVESGQITVEGDGPMFLWREVGGPASEPTTLPTGSTVVLDPGDALYLPVGTSGRRRNDATQPAVFMGYQLTQQEILLHPAGVTDLRIVPDKILNASPPAPATLGLHRLRLDPGERVPLISLPGLQMLYVEAGTLDLMGARRLGDLSPTSWTSIPAGQGMAHFDATTALANSTAEPATVLLVTIEPTP